MVLKPVPPPGRGAAGGQAQPRELSQSYVPEGGTYTGKNMGEAAAERLQTPELPAGATVISCWYRNTTEPIN